MTSAHGDAEDRPLRSPVAGAVLTGGASSRMGRDKAVLHIEGTPLVARMAAVLRAAGAVDVTAVGGDERAISATGIPVVRDAHPGDGPLGGVSTALHHVRGTHRRIVIVACDLVRLDADTVRRLVDASDRTACDVALAVTDRPEPLCAVWTVGTSLGPVDAALAEGERAVHRVLGRLRTVCVPVDPRALHNANRPEDLIAP